MTGRNSLVQRSRVVQRGTKLQLRYFSGHPLRLASVTTNNGFRKHNPGFVPLSSPRRENTGRSFRELLECSPWLFTPTKTYPRAQTASAFVLLSLRMLRRLWRL